DVVVAQRDQAPGEGKQRLALVVDVLPVQPADLAVLAVGVVVAALAAAELVAGHQHRDTLRQQRGGDEVAHLLAAQLADFRVVGRAFGAAVPAVVVVAAVAVVLPVRLVVLTVVGDEVAQGEAVVGGDEVGAGPGPAPAPVVDVGGAGDARGELG